MKNNDLLKLDGTVYRIIEIEGDKAFVVDCSKVSVPKWMLVCDFDDAVPCELEQLSNLDELSPRRRKSALKRFSIISGVLPFIKNKNIRCNILNQLAEETKVTAQTLNKHIWLFLKYQSISALAPTVTEGHKDLSDNEKNFRWALNKYYYTKNKLSLPTTYTLMLKSKYLDENGQLLPDYPTFNMFYYFYTKYKSIRKYYISREGKGAYQRNHRPLLGESIQDFAPTVGYGMLDATVCDIYLVNEEGNVVGRPILTACVDAFSGMCCGYSLTWEGGTYSLRNLMLNVIEDKVEHCEKYGIEIERSDWNCTKMPTTFITDRGKEYTSSTFEQIAELGVRIINLPAFRPELKGAVEIFFGMIQNTYKPYLKGKGVIEPDFQERGGRDYRKDACLTMRDFEKVILNCIIHYNTKMLVGRFSYSPKMRDLNVKPYRKDIWNYGLEDCPYGLIDINPTELILTLLPRTKGRFTRRGLIVNKLRYNNRKYIEKFLTGGTCTVAYNPEDVNDAWLIEDGVFVKFELINSRFSQNNLKEVVDAYAKERLSLDMEKDAVTQAKIDLADKLITIANMSEGNGENSLKNIAKTRKREELKQHKDYVKEVDMDEDIAG